MPMSLFYVVRQFQSAVPGASWVLLDPPPGGAGATDGHTIGILMRSDRAAATEVGRAGDVPRPDAPQPRGRTLH